MDEDGKNGPEAFYQDIREAPAEELAERTGHSQLLGTSQFQTAYVLEGPSYF